MIIKNKTYRKTFLHLMSIAVIAITVIFLIAIAKAYIDGEFQSIESFQKYIARFGSFGPLFLTVFQIVQVVLPVIPGFFGCAAGAVLFGPLVGFLCNYIGISAGSIIAFGLAKKFGAPLVNDLFPTDKYGKWYARASKSKSYVAFLFLAMVLPLFPDDFLCYLTGLTEMDTQKFSTIILLGKPWCILAYSLGFSIIS